MLVEKKIQKEQLLADVVLEPPFGGDVCVLRSCAAIQRVQMKRINLSNNLGPAGNSASEEGINLHPVLVKNQRKVWLKYQQNFTNKYLQDAGRLGMYISKHGTAGRGVWTRG